MLDVCRQRLALFNHDYVFECEQLVEITETNPGGEGTARFEVSVPAVVIRAHHQGPLLWALQVRKCADGSFVTFGLQGVHLHLVELKSSLTLKEWSNVLRQYEGMYLASIAAARLMGIGEFPSVTCYMAFTRDQTSGVSSASPALLKTLVGRSRPLGGEQEWTKQEVRLPFEVTARLVKVQRDPSGNADFGLVA